MLSGRLAYANDTLLNSMLPLILSVGTNGSLSAFCLGIAGGRLMRYSIRPLAPMPSISLAMLPAAEEIKVDSLVQTRLHSRASGTVSTF